MRGVAILLCALALIGAAAASSNGRELLANDKLPTSSKDLPACPPNLPVTETGVPGLKPMINVRTKVNGPSTRNFTCFGGVPKTYSEYFAGLSQVEGFWFGDLYYDSNGFPTFDLTFQDPYNDYFKTSRKVVTFKEFTEVPSPTGAAPWARYKVMSDTGSPPFSYVERTNTVGGAVPTQCKSDTSDNVFYEANYNFYMCNEGAPAPVAPIVPAVPVMPSPMLSPPAVAPVAAAPVPAAAVAPVPAPVPVAPAPTTPEPVVTSPSPSSVSPSPAIVVSSGTSTSTIGAFVATLATVMLAMLA